MVKVAFLLAAFFASCLLPAALDAEAVLQPARRPVRTPSPPPAVSPATAPPPPIPAQPAASPRLGQSPAPPVADGIRRWPTPFVYPQRLKPAGRLEHPALRECSGLAASLTHAGVYWALNDSGNAPSLYAIDAFGRTNGVSKEHGKTNGHASFPVDGAHNFDWEALAPGPPGTLFIGDVGNNSSGRRNLLIYEVREPDPGQPGRIAISRRLPVHFADQHQFPSPDRNFDCEAIFWANGKLYALTKHRTNANTVLCRLESQSEDRSNPFVPMVRFQAGDMVTDSAVTPDGNRLAILTLSAVWVFSSQAGADDWLSHAPLWKPIMAGQAEAICWLDESTLLLTNEQRDLYHLPLSQLRQL